MIRAKDGDTVKIHYRGVLNDGSVFETSYGKNPVELKLGQSAALPGFEYALLGMKSGAKKTVSIPSQQAHGAYRPDLLAQIERSSFPYGHTPKPNTQIEIQDEQGRIRRVRVKEVGEDYVLVDGNHPLAGQPVRFEIELVEINQ